MAWEQRRNGNYYYRKTWRHGTCVSQYVGSGLLGQVAAGRDRRARQARQVGSPLGTVATSAALLRQWDALDHLSELVGALLGSHLVLAGYHTHKRQWRKQRDQTSIDRRREAD
jgi:hypothetical protein